MSLIDYRGFRLVAISLLPLSPNSLLYGSQDGGVTIQNSDPILAKKMDLAAKMLNLRPHLCGLNETKELASAADVEGHRGKGGEYYLLDFSRTLPPVKPDHHRYVNSHLYYLFRKEFLAKYSKKPLCSDAFSSFIINDPKAKEYNRLISIYH